MTFTEADFQALVITLKLAAWTTSILLFLGTPLAWWLARSTWRYRFVAEAVVALPLILPPTVLGFYLLLVLGPQGWLGGWMNSLGLEAPAFTFSGLVMGSVLYSLPFVVQPLQDAFSSIGRRPLEVAATLGAAPWDRFFSVAVPLAMPGFLTATVLGFAHTIGEFGVVLMIGGNIPGQTKVLSIAIYDHVESMEYGQAHTLAGGLLLASFVLLMLIYASHRRFRFTKI